MRARRVWLTPPPRIAVSCVGFGRSPRYGYGSGSEEAVSPRSPRAFQAAFPDALIPQRGVRG